MKISGYRIDEQIGKGGMAMVYRATQESLGRPVALKIMNPLFSDTPEFSERFLDEGRLLAAVRHTNIITIHDIGISDGFHFISMEYVEGGDLGDRIRAGISPQEATAYIETLASCLAAAHELHIVHRDIKPANILFRKDGTLLLSDFGIAKQLTIDKGLTATGSLVGSPHYLSPEQAQGKPVDGRADIYSLGVLYYEMLVGGRPFTGDSDVEIAIKHVTESLPPLPEALTAYAGVLDRMTRKQPEERFPSCASLLAALRELRESGRWSGEVAPIPLPAVPVSPSASAAAPAEQEGGGEPSGPEADTVVAHDTPPAARTCAAPSGGAGERAAAGGGDTLVLDGASTAEDGATVVLGDETPATPTSFGAARTSPTGTPAQPAAPRTSRPRPLPIVGGLAAAVAAIAAAVLLTVARESTPDAAPEATRATTPPVRRAAAPSRTDAAEAAAAERERRAREQQIASLLRDARAAIEDYRLTTPKATSAYTYYRKVLALDPDNTEAQEGIDEIADIYLLLARKAERAWDYDRAMRFVDSGLEVRETHPGLRALAQELRAEDGKTTRSVKQSLKGLKGLFD